MRVAVAVWISERMICSLTWQCPQAALLPFIFSNLQADLETWMGC